MSNELIISIITLIVTVLGWGITYNSQRRILHMQIEAEKERASRGWVTPRRIQNLDELRGWLVRGQRLFYSCQIETVKVGDIDEEKVTELVEEMKDWVSRSWAFQNWLKAEGHVELHKDVTRFSNLMSNFSESRGKNYALDIWENGGDSIKRCFKEIERIVQNEAT